MHSTSLRNPGFSTAGPAPRPTVRLEAPERGQRDGVDGHTPGPSWDALAGALVDGVPALLDEVRAMLRPVAPEYAEFLIADRADVVVAAEAAMRAFVEHARRRLSLAPSAEAGLLPDTVLAMFADVGQNQWGEGFALRTLLSAYQVGGRVAWRHIAATALRRGLDAAVLAALAESVFYFIDELCAASTDGYVAAQTASAAEREHRRDLLVELLLSGSSDNSALLAAAGEAGWSLPKRASIVFVQPGDDNARRAVTRLGALCLPVRTATLPGVIVPDADGPGQRARLSIALRGCRAVVGKSVALQQLPVSARRVELAAELLVSGALSGDPLFVDEHLDAVIVHRDPRLLGLLREQCLAPLDEATPASKQMLQETLRSWLRNMGDRAAMAEELHVHRQTVRYRLARLQELFGSALQDPDHRARLMLALAWEPVAESSR